MKLDKTPIYYITKLNGKYYFNNKQLTPDWYLWKYRKDLINKSKKYNKQFFGKIMACPGIYGIFDRKTGRCLYIGQSHNIKNRVKQHKLNIKIASNHIKGLKLHSKYKSINKLVPKNKRKVEWKYYELSKYTIKGLKFIIIRRMPKEFKSFTQVQQNECLTFYEQLAMTIFKPKLNTIAARPIDF